MSFRKFGTGEITGADDTHQTVQQQEEDLRRSQVGEPESGDYSESPVDGEADTESSR